MKNITALRILVIIIFSFSLSYKAGCQEEGHERNYGFSFGTQFGFIHGQSFEYVYPTITKGEFLSELIWDIKPVYYYGFQLSFGRIDLMKAPGFFTSLSFKSGVPADSGIMEDRDWMSTSDSSLTRFSSHTNKTSAQYQLDIYIGASIPINTYFYIKPFIAGSWMNFSFSGRDGWGIYHDYTPPDTPEQTFTGTVITYTQDWLLIAAGFSIGTKILYPFSFELSFQISPFGYCAATDDHILRNIIFKDFTSWGLFLEPAGSFSFTVGKIEFSLEAAYRYIGRTTGNTYYNDNTTNFYKSSNKGGASLSLFDLSFLVKLNI